MEKKSYFIQYAGISQASEIASMIMTAMSKECCLWLAGPKHTLGDLHQLLASLVERDDTQYSYLNTLVAIDGNELKGICTSYDGARLRELRQPFIDGAKEALDMDHSKLDEETQAGELYLDSLCVKPSYRRQGIASSLIKASIKRARELKLPSVGLLVDFANPNAEKLYRSLGFQLADERMWCGHRMKHLSYIL